MSFSEDIDPFSKEGEGPVRCFHMAEGLIEFEHRMALVEVESVMGTVLETKPEITRAHRGRRREEAQGVGGRISTVFL